MLQTKQKKLKTKEGEAQLVIDNETSRQRLAGTALLNNLKSPLRLFKRNRIK